MSGSADPPEGTPEGAPGGGEEEYRSVVFDESFVKAARIQEFSAQERLDGAPRAVRMRHVLPRGLARQAMALVMLIMLAFGFAIYMGVRHPYRAAAPAAAAQLRVSLLPLVPPGRVPAVSAAAPFAGGAAAHYDAGTQGLRLPSDIRRIGTFARDEVQKAYSYAQEYLTDSGLDQQTVTGGDVRKIRDLLDPRQLGQFDSSLTSPSDDGRHEATGWLVRFDPAAQVTLVGDARVHGTLDATETSDKQLEINADHVFVYALRGPGSAHGAPSLFTVRRQLRFRFDHQELRQHHIEVVTAAVMAGPLPCTTPVEGFRPILAGQSAPGPVAGVDPYDQGRQVGARCAPLSPEGAPTAPATTTPTGTQATGSPAGGTPAGDGPVSSPAADPRWDPTTRPVSPGPVIAARLPR